MNHPTGDNGTIDGASLAEALQQAGVGGFALSEGRGLTVDDGFLALLGCPREDLPPDLVAWWTGRVHPEDRQHLLQPRTDRSEADAKPRAVDLRVLHAGGDYVWVRYTASWRGDGLIGTIQDISEPTDRERMLSAFVEHAPWPVFLKDADGRFRFANSAMRNTVASLQGTPIASLTGLHHRDVDPDNADQIDARDQHMLKVDRPVTFVDSFETPEGPLHVHVNLFPVRDADGTTNVGGVALDVTSRVEAETRAAKQATELDSLVHHMPVAILTYRYEASTDQFVLTRANTAANAMLGFQVTGREGETMAEIFPGVERTQYPKRYADIALNGGQFLETQNAYEDENIRGVFDAITFQSAPCEVTIMFTDVSERERQAQAMLEANRALESLTVRHQLALRASGIGVWEWDVPSNNLQWDAQCFTLYGQRPGEFTPQYDAWLSCLHAGDRSRVHQLVQEVASGNAEYDTEFRIVRPNGSVRNLRATGEAVFGADGELLRLVGVNWDVTNERLRAAELERSNGELQKFAYVTSHDLQAPLRSIAGLAEILDVEYADKLDDDGRECVRSVVRGCERLQLMIRELLEYSRIGARPVAFGVVDLNVVLREVIEMLDAGSGGEPSVHCPGPLPAVQGDHTQLRQLLQNIISNGLKYNRSDEPSVTVRAESTAGGIRLLIEDNGIGIAPHQRDKIFGVFTRLHHAHEFPGTGIGLSICRKVAERHGGTIAVESRAGAGSIFKIDLPQPKTHGAPAPQVRSA